MFVRYTARNQDVRSTLDYTERASAELESHPGGVTADTRNSDGGSEKATHKRSLLG